jgi:hypothetical protein
MRKLCVYRPSFVVTAPAPARRWILTGYRGEAQVTGYFTTERCAWTAAMKFARFGYEVNVVEGFGTFRPTM